MTGPNCGSVVKPTSSSTPGRRHRAGRGSPVGRVARPRAATASSRARRAARPCGRAAPRRTAPASVLCTSPSADRLQRDRRHRARRPRRPPARGVCDEPPGHEREPVAARELLRPRRARASPTPEASARAIDGGRLVATRRGMHLGRRRRRRGRASRRSAPPRRARGRRPPGTRARGCRRPAGPAGGSCPVRNTATTGMRDPAAATPSTIASAASLGVEHERRHVDDRERVERRGPRPALRPRRAAAPSSRRRARRRDCRGAAASGSSLRSARPVARARRRQLEPGRLGGVGEQDRGPAGVGDDAEARAGRRRLRREQAGDVEQLADSCRCGSRRPGRRARRRWRRMPRRGRRCASRRRAIPRASGPP